MDKQKNSKRPEAVKLEGKVMRCFSRHEDEIRRFYTEQTGLRLPRELDSFKKKDMLDRWLFWNYFDVGFVQNGIMDGVDGTASGVPCELKYNTYGFNQCTKAVIDERKVDGMPDDGKVVFIYFEPDLSMRQFAVGDIKKYGEKSNDGGRTDNVSCSKSEKTVYFIGHRYAEAEHIYGGQKEEDS